MGALPVPSRSSSLELLAASGAGQNLGHILVACVDCPAESPKALVMLTLAPVSRIPELCEAF